MDLYHRLKNAMDEGRRISELNRRHLYLRETLHEYLHGYNTPAARNKPESSFSSTACVAGRIYGSIGLDACCKESNELSDKRTKRVYAFGDEELSKLERRVEDFGYDLGYKIENMGQRYRDLARGYDVWKYNQRRLKAKEKGWDAHQFFENERKIHEIEEAKKARRKRSK